jgi:hypothetical protein
MAHCGSGRVINRVQNLSFPIAPLPAKDQWPLVQEIFMNFSRLEVPLLVEGEENSRQAQTP